MERGRGGRQYELIAGFITDCLATEISSSADTLAYEDVITFTST